MTASPPSPEAELRSSATLRARAEKALSEETHEPASDEQAQRELVYELRVHQIELELQNDELRRAHHALQVSRDRYRDLYDRAPVGYVALDSGTVIREANLTAAELVGVDRFALLSRPFASLLDREAADRLHVHIQRTLSSESIQSCEFPLRRPDGSLVDLHLESVAVESGPGRLPACRSTLSEVRSRVLRYLSLTGS